MLTYHNVSVSYPEGPSYIPIHNQEITRWARSNGGGGGQTHHATYSSTTDYRTDGLGETRYSSVGFAEASASALHDHTNASWYDFTHTISTSNFRVFVNTFSSGTTSWSKLIPSFVNSIATLQSTTLSTDFTEWTSSSYTTDSSFYSVQRTTGQSVGWSLTQSLTTYSSYRVYRPGNQGNSYSASGSASGSWENVYNQPSYVYRLDNATALWNSYTATVVVIPENEETVYMLDAGAAHLSEMKSYTASFSYTKSYLERRHQGLTGTALIHQYTTSSFTASTRSSVSYGSTHPTSYSYIAFHPTCVYETTTRSSSLQEPSLSTAVWERNLGVHGNNFGPFPSSTVNQWGESQSIYYTHFGVVFSTVVIANPAFLSIPTFNNGAYIEVIPRFGSLLHLAKNTAGYCEPTSKPPSAVFKTWDPNLKLFQKNTREYHIGGTENALALFNHFLGAPLPFTSSTTSTTNISGTTSSTTSSTYSFEGSGEGGTSTGYFRDFSNLNIGGTRAMLQRTANFLAIWDYRKEFAMSNAIARLTPFEGVTHSLVYYPQWNYFSNAYSLMQIEYRSPNSSGTLELSNYASGLSSISVGDGDFSYLGLTPNLTAIWALAASRSYEMGKVFIGSQGDSIQSLYPAWFCFRLLNEAGSAIPIQMSFVDYCGGNTSSTSSTAY